MTLDKCKHYCDIDDDCNAIERGPNDKCTILTNKVTDSDPMEFDERRTTYFRNCGNAFFLSDIHLIMRYYYTYFRKFLLLIYSLCLGMKTKISRKESISKSSIDEEDTEIMELSSKKFNKFGGYDKA